MPIPVPQADANGNPDLGSCIRFLRKEGYSDSDQRVAICLNLFRKHHPKSKKAQKPKGS